MRELGYEYDLQHHAFLAISKYCNIDCSYCYLPSSNKNQKVDRDGRAVTMLQDLSEKAKRERFALNRSHLHGAEPTTLTPEAFREAVNLTAAITTADLTTVQTNGIALNRSYHERMGDLRDKLAIGFSLDLPRAAHNKNRQGTYDKVVENIAIARDLGYVHRLLVSINRDTMSDLDAVSEAFGMLHSEFPSMSITLKITSGDQALTGEQKGVLADYLFDNDLHDYAMSISGSVCQAHGNNCCLFEFHVDGGVTACNKSNNDESVFANWREESMNTIFHKRRTLFQNHTISAECFGCRYWEVCQGGCPVDRDPETSELLDCAIKKRIYRRMELCGLNPITETRQTPRFPRQKAYNSWIDLGRKYGFSGEQT